MKKPKYFVLNDETWHFGLIVAFGGRYVDAARYYQKRIGESYEVSDPVVGVKARTHYHQSHKTCLIWFREKKPLPEVVAHECFHVANYILTASGVVFSDGSDEAWAYLLERLVRFVNEVQRKVK